VITLTVNEYRPRRRRQSGAGDVGGFTRADIRNGGRFKGFVLEAVTAF
jgi:hypothetical protein